MYRFLAAWTLLLALAPPLVAQGEPGLTEEAARRAALQFGQALRRADTSLLTRILPERGLLKLRLDSLGIKEGSYSADQVAALIKGFLREGSVSSFDLLRLGECEQARYVIVHGRARLTDRGGRPAEVELRLSFQPESGRWVLREVRESPP